MNIYSAKEVAYMSKPSDQIITIQIDGKEIKVSKKEMTGKEIKALSQAPAEYLLILIVGKPDDIADGGDKSISDDEQVMLQGGMIFRTAKALIISINNESIPVSKLAMTGKEIKMLVNGPLDYLLTRVSEEGDDKSISDDELVMLKDGMRFRIVNPATFG